MASIYWRSNRSGDWADARNWVGGLPTDGDRAYLRGAGFTVTLSTAQRVGGLVLSGAGVVLREVAGGALAVGDEGTVEISNGARFQVAGLNPDFAAATQVADATIAFTAGSALGTGTLTFRRATLEALGDATLGGKIYSVDPGFSLDPVNRILSANGATLTLAGFVDFEGSTLIGDAQHRGTVILAGEISCRAYTLEVGGGRLMIAPNSQPSNNPVKLLTNLVIDAGAKFDLGGNIVEVDDLHNAGTITSTGAVGTLRLADDYFVVHGGTITGAVMVTVPPFTGAPYETYTGKLDGSLSLSNGGGITLINAYLEVRGSLSIAKSASITVRHEGNGPQLGYLHIYSDFAIGGAVNLVDGGELLLYGSGTITSSVKSLVVTGGESGYLAVVSAGAVALSGKLDGVFLVMSGSGTLTLSHANTLDLFDQSSGTVKLAAAGALKGGDLYLSGGTLIAGVNDTLSNAVTLTGAATIAAAHGVTLGLKGTIDADRSFYSLTLGTTAADGAIVFDMTSTQAAGGALLNVDAGTVRLGNGADLQSALSLFSTVTVAAEARLDLRGRSVLLTGLAGTGSVTAGGGTASTLTLAGGAFGGTISGTGLAVAITVARNTDASPLTQLGGRSTYRGGTTIEVGATLSLADGGSVLGAIVDRGVLEIDKTGGYTLANAISGGGALQQFGSGVTRVTGANTYSGGTLIYDGAISIANAASLGIAAVYVYGGRLITSAGGTIGGGDIVLSGGALELAGPLTLNGTIYSVFSGTVSAAHGVTATVASAFSLFGGAAVTFGTGRNDGTLHLAPASLTSDGSSHTIALVGGTLVLDTDGAADLLSRAASLSVAAPATLDLAGHALSVQSLQQLGTLTNSGPAAAVTLYGGISQGAISGAIDVTLLGNALFAGAGSFRSLTTSGAVAVTFAGAASESVRLDGGGATVVLAATAALTGTVAGFTAGDAFDLLGVGYSAATKLSYAAATHTLSVTDGSATVTLVLDGSYTKASFALSNDGSGHALVSFAGAGAHPAFDHAAAEAFGGDTAPALDPVAFAAPAPADLLLAA